MGHPETFLRSLLPAALFAAALGGACDTTTDDDNAEVLALIDRAIDLENDAVEIVCDCWDEAGFSTRNACLSDQILPSQRRCVENAYLREPESSRLYLECLVPLIDELRVCLDAKLECADVGPTDACFDDYDLGREECIQLPNSVDRALDDCSGDGSDAANNDGGDGSSAPSPDDSGTTSGGDDPQPTPGDSAEEGGEDPSDDSGPAPGDSAEGGGDDGAESDSGGDPSPPDDDGGTGGPAPGDGGDDGGDEPGPAPAPGG